MLGQMIKIVAAILICFNICYAQPPASQYRRQCVVSDVTYYEGDTVPSSDSCNTCTCTADGVTCTEIACPTGCNQNGVEYSLGDNVPSLKNTSCEQCICRVSGIECQFAPPPCPAPIPGCIYKNDDDPCSCGTSVCGCYQNEVEYSLRDKVPSQRNFSCEECICSETGIECQFLPTFCTTLLGCIYKNESDPCGCGSAVCHSCVALDGTGTKFAIGDQVPTEDVCSNCSCTEVGIVCAIVDCAPPPDGCELSQNPEKCCDYICEKCTQNGVDFNIGDNVPSLSNISCESCTCTENGIECQLLSVTCPQPPDGCTYIGGDSCSCGILECEKCTQNGVEFSIGDNVPSPSNLSCESCTCTKNGIDCPIAAVACEPPALCTFIGGDSCSCGILECKNCTQYGVEFSIGDNVPSPNNIACESCTCTANGINCYIEAVTCAPPPEGCTLKGGDSCSCGVLECEKCTHNGVEYSIGDSVPSPSSNPCESCTCIESGIDCLLPPITCPQPPVGCRFVVGHQCLCGTFECEKCTHNGVEYSIGDSVPSSSNNPCESCTCIESGIDCQLFVVDCASPPDGCRYVGGHDCSCGTLECEGQTTPSPACNEYDPDCPQGQGPTVREAVLVAVREDFNSTEYGP